MRQHRGRSPSSQHKQESEYASSEGRQTRGNIMNKPDEHDKTGMALPNDEGVSWMKDVDDILQLGLIHAASAVHAVAVMTFWKVGRRIVEEEQSGTRRAAYGENLLERLAVYLRTKYEGQYTSRKLREYRQFYILFPDFEIWHSRVPNLTWTHIRQVLPVQNENARYWYLKEAERENWSARTLSRIVGSQFYQRLMISPSKDAVLQEMQEKTAKNPPMSVEFVKSPVIAEFLNLTPNCDFTENELESAILTHICRFVMELGRGFSFVARQQHLVADGEDYFIDLVFYNIILKCYVLIDLKTHKLSHQDVGQMDMYVRMYDDLKRIDGDNPTIGLLLCSENGPDTAKYTALNGSKQIFAAKYLTVLPSQEELAIEIERQKEIFFLARPEINDSCVQETPKNNDLDKKNTQGN